MFKLLQEMMSVNTWVKFRDNRLRNEFCKVVTPFEHVRMNMGTNIHTGRSLYFCISSLFYKIYKLTHLYSSYLWWKWISAADELSTKIVG